MSVRDLTHSLLNRRSWHFDRATTNGEHRTARMRELPASVYAQNKLDIRKPAIDMIGASL